MSASGASERISSDALLLGGTVAVPGLNIGAALGCSPALFGVPLPTPEKLRITVP